MSAVLHSTVAEVIESTRVVATEQMRLPWVGALRVEKVLPLVTLLIITVAMLAKKKPPPETPAVDVVRLRSPARMPLLELSTYIIPPKLSAEVDETVICEMSRV